MLQTVSQLLPELPLILMTAVATHLVMSFAQTLMHYKLGHHPMGGKFFRNHINFHHAHYSKDHLVSRTYLGDEGNNTPFFFIPVFLVGACTYLVLPADLFVAQLVACAASFYAHVFFDKEYHIEGSRLQRFAWFRRKQELHFVHHRHANSNFAVIHFFWDRTRRRASACSWAQSTRRSAPNRVVDAAQICRRDGAGAGGDQSRAGLRTCRRMLPNGIPLSNPWKEIKNNQTIKAEVEARGKIDRSIQNNSGLSQGLGGLSAAG